MSSRKALAHKSASKKRRLTSIEAIRDAPPPIRAIQAILHDEHLPRKVAQHVIHEDRCHEVPESIEVPAQEDPYINGRVTDTTFSGSESDESSAEFLVVRPERCYEGPGRRERYTLDSLKNSRQNIFEKIIRRLCRRTGTMLQREWEENREGDVAAVNNERRNARRPKKKERYSSSGQTVEWNDMFAANGGFITITPEDDPFDPNSEVNRLEFEDCAEELSRRRARQSRFGRKRRINKGISTESSLFVHQDGDPPAKKVCRTKSSGTVVICNMILTASLTVLPERS